MTPRQAKRCCEVDRLKDTCIGSGDYWFLVDQGYVTLTKQPKGATAEKQMHIPRRVFNIFVDWYNTGSKKGKKK